MKLTDISKKYGDSPIIEHFSAEFPPGKTSCILGKSGCGKTTLLNIASGLLVPDSGRIETESQRYTYLFQDDRLLPWYDVKKNITVLGVSEERAMYYINKVDLSGAEKKLPGELSGGMRRRAAIARALAYGGDTYFLDEPCRGLDGKTKDLILELLAAELQGKTGIVITHDIYEAEVLQDQTFLTWGPPLKVIFEYKAGNPLTLTEVLNSIKKDEMKNA